MGILSRNNCKMAGVEKYVDEAVGFDSTEGDGSQAKPYKSVSYAYLQHGGETTYLVKNKEKGEGEPEWKAAAKAALKKAANYADQQKKKAVRMNLGETRP